MKVAAAMARLGTESAFQVLARAHALEATGRRIIHLEIGGPDFPTPDHVLEAGIRALRDGHTHYAPAPGVPELREAAAAYLSRSRGISVNPGNVVVTPGAQPLLLFGVLATCDPGDEVVYPDPGFPIYRSIIEWAGATPVPLTVRERDGEPAFDADELSRCLSERTRLVILDFPSNPTGRVLDPATAKQAIERLEAHHCWALLDEIYSELQYEQHVTLAAGGTLLDRAILVDGFSKTFSMTGWRVQGKDNLRINYTASVKDLEGAVTAMESLLRQSAR